MQKNPKPMRLILETNISANLRAMFYSLPLFLAWLPAIFWEREEKPLSFAKQGFTLAFFYILLNGFLFFVQGIVEYFLGKGNEVLAYFLFSASLVITLLYIGLSFTNAWLLFRQGKSLSFLEKASVRLESFLSR